MKFHLYRNATGDWAWTLIARNGKKVACGGEGYKRFGAMVRTLRGIFGGSSLVVALEKAVAEAAR
jgi:hypothetical protein